VLNLSVLDGWWPEACRHGENGWRVGDAAGDLAAEESERDRDAADRNALYRVLEQEVAPLYAGDRRAWIDMMLSSIAMSQWRFSSDRMLEDYYRELYPRAP
jgi:starch phosphorylase